MKNKKKTKDFVPFGKEWIEGMKKHSKESLIELLANACKKNIENEEHKTDWIKIESEDDLPKETTECWFKSYGELFLGYYNSDFKRFNTMNVLFNINEVTHCQPIVKPSLPIY